MNRKAFTLIELLVVIAIIAILAAILFPVFARARSKARQIQCLSNIKQFGTATVMYMTDYNDCFPTMWLQCRDANGRNIACPGPTWTGQGYYWHEVVIPYIKTEQVLLCPEQPGAKLTPQQLPYGFNWFWLGNDRDINKKTVKGNSINSPAETIMIADGKGRPVEGSEKPSWFEDGKPYIYGHRINPTSLANCTYLTSKRHFGLTNAVFIDNHAQAINYNDINNCNNLWDGRGISATCRKCTGDCNGFITCD